MLVFILSVAGALSPLFYLKAFGVGGLYSSYIDLLTLPEISSVEVFYRLVTCLRLHFSLLWFFLFVGDGDFIGCYVPATNFTSFRLAVYADNWFAKS